MLAFAVVGRLASRVDRRKDPVLFRGIRKGSLASVAEMRIIYPRQTLAYGPNQTGCMG